MKNEAILAIVGPTASGKSELGQRLAKEKNGEIVSVDSRQVYRHLSVGTAKPPGAWTSDKTYLVDNVPYHLVDILDPSASFSAAAFVSLAKEKISDIQARGKTPILVGGTGLYFTALTEGMADLPPADTVVRARLIKEAEETGREALHKRLAAIDPEAAGKIPANNIQRLVRALEVYELTGKPISTWHKEHQQRLAPSPLPSPPKGTRGIFINSSPPAGGRGVGEGGPSLKFVGIDVPREELVRRIETRCRTMMAEGMVEETQALLKKGFVETCPALSGLGYPRIIAMLKGTLSKDECLALLIQDTRQYAKRQMTWFRHQLPVEWKK